MRYTDHVADLRAALADTSRRRNSNNNNNTNNNSTGGDVRTALSLLHADGLAQLMSYVPLSPTASADTKEKTKESRPLLLLLRTLRAVCPQLRLDAEVLCGGYFTNRRAGSVGVCADAGQLWCCVRTPRSERNRRSDDDDNGDGVNLLSMCLWWARRCGLPLWLKTHYTRSNLFMTILRSDLGRCKIQKISVVFTNNIYPSLRADEKDAKTSPVTHLATAAVSTSTVVSDPGVWDFQWRPCVTDFLHWFPNLQAVLLDCDNAKSATRHIDTIERALHILSAMPQCADVTLSRCSARMNLSRAADLSHLHSLTLQSSYLCALPHTLKNCAALSEFCIRDCPMVTSPEALAGAPNLKRLTATKCDLRDVDGLDECAALTTLDVSKNTDLTNLAGLAKAPCLTELTASHCGLSSIDDLQHVISLQHLDVSHNPHLISLAAVAGLRNMQMLFARHCDVRFLGQLSRCRALHTLDVRGNRTLEELSGLAGAPRLACVIASDCDVRCIDGLAQCPQLQHINIDGCRHLTSLSGLVGAPQLTHVMARRCGLRDLANLRECRALTHLNVDENLFLAQLDGLAGAPSLSFVSAQWCCVVSLRGLAHCPALTTLLLDGNRELMSVAEAATMTQLRVFSAKECGS